VAQIECCYCCYVVAVVVVVEIVMSEIAVVVVVVANPFREKKSVQNRIERKIFEVIQIVEETVLFLLVSDLTEKL